MPAFTSWKQRWFHHRVRILKIPFWAPAEYGSFICQRFYRLHCAIPLCNCRDTPLRNWHNLCSRQPARIPHSYSPANWPWETDPKHPQDTKPHTRRTLCTAPCLSRPFLWLLPYFYILSALRHCLSNIRTYCFKVNKNNCKTKKIDKIYNITLRHVLFAVAKLPVVMRLVKRKTHFYIITGTLFHIETAP